MPMMGIASSRPHTPQSHSQKSNAINTVTEFTFEILPVILPAVRHEIIANRRGIADRPTHQMHSLRTPARCPGSRVRRFPHGHESFNTLFSARYNPRDCHLASALLGPSRFHSLPYAIRYAPYAHGILPLYEDTPSAASIFRVSFCSTVK
jgi:hypothetical protein